MQIEDRAVVLGPGVVASFRARWSGSDWAHIQLDIHRGERSTHLEGIEQIKKLSHSLNEFLRQADEVESAGIKDSLDSLNREILRLTKK